MLLNNQDQAPDCSNGDQQLCGVSEGMLAPYEIVF